MVLPPELVGSDMANTPCKKWRLNVESRADGGLHRSPTPYILRLMSTRVTPRPRLYRLCNGRCKLAVKLTATALTIVAKNPDSPSMPTTAA
jgi:hypothetical protein